MSGDITATTVPELQDTVFLAHLASAQVSDIEM
jgi:hypothetical protein